MKYITENFKSIEHLIMSNETRHDNEVFKNKHSSEDSDDEFTKTRSYAEAVELIKNGYVEPLEQIKRGVEVASKGMRTQKTAIKNDIVGYAPCVPNAILGIPQSMINKDVAVKKSKIITICYDSTGAWHVDADTFIKSGIAVLTIINSLEANGYRVALKVAFYNASSSDEKIFATIMLKDWRQPLDLKKMAFPFCHPSMLRRIGFKWLETCPDIHSTSWCLGYGTSDSNANGYFEMRDKLLNNKLIDENEKFINIKLCSENDFDPQAIAKACGLE